MPNGGDHWRICPTCGKPHCPPDLTNYRYKRVSYTGHGKVRETVYFCKYTHMLAWDEKHKRKKGEKG